MEYTYLGDTGLEVSRLCLGTAGFSYGGPDSRGDPWTIHDAETCRAIVDRAIDAGITFVDTANLYSYGESEEILGEAIDGVRDDLVIASKVGKVVDDGPNGSGLSRKHVIQEAHDSLDRLGTDYLDLYYIHMWDYETPIEETLSALTHLVDEGLVRYIGASNLTGWELTKALYAADLEGYERFACVQPEYNLVARHEEENLLPPAVDEGLGVVPYAPLAAGFLTGEYDRDSGDEDLRAEDRTYRDLGRYATEAGWRVLDEIRAIADAEDATPVQVAVAWLLQEDIVDAPIIGPRNLDHLDEYLGALDLSLDEDEMARLEAPVDPAWDASLLNR